RCSAYWWFSLKRHGRLCRRRCPATTLAPKRMLWPDKPRATASVSGNFVKAMTTKSLTSPIAQRLAGKEGRRVPRFLVVGALGFVVDFGVFNIAHALGFGTWVAGAVLPALLPHPEIIEQTLSLSIAIANNFVWNYFWIYPEARQANQAGKMVKFVIVSVAGL